MIGSNLFEGRYQCKDQESIKAVGYKEFSIKELTVSRGDFSSGEHIPKIYIFDPDHLEEYQSFITPLETGRGFFHSREMKKGRYLLASGSVWFKIEPGGELNFEVLMGEFRYTEGGRTLYKFTANRIDEST